MLVLGMNVVEHMTAQQTQLRITGKGPREHNILTSIFLTFNSSYLSCGVLM